MHGRLIDADALRESWLDWNPYEIIEANTVLESIDQTPTVDAVPVVRCKDCKHGGLFVIEDNAPFFACYKSKPDVKPVKRDWFCADGVRKDDAE